MKSFFITMFSWLILYSAEAWAQENMLDTSVVHPLNEIEVQAAEFQHKSSLTQPLSITKLSNLELKRSIGLYLDDAINVNVPGVYMVRRTVGAGQQFNIRGYGNGVRGTNGVNSNFDGQGYKVYLNGIPVTDAEGITIMDDIDFNSVGRVQVLKGPMGTRYGLAIAGVVELFTQSPENGKTSLTQDVLAGTDGLQRFTTRLQSGNEKGSWMLNYGHQQYDGFTYHTASQKDFVNFLGEWKTNEKQSIGLYAGYSNSYDQRNGELTIDQYENDDYSGNPAYIKNDAHSSVISFRAGVKHSYAFSEKFSNTTSLFGTGVNNNASSAGGWTDRAPLNYGARTEFDLKLPLGSNLNLKGTIGGEAQQQYVQSAGYAMIANPDTTQEYNIIGTVRSNTITRTQTASVFTDWSLSFPGNLTISAGVGLSFMGIRLDDRIYVAGSTKPTRYEQSYGDMVAPSFAINKIFNEKLSVYGAYTAGYKAPVSSYFYIPTTGEVNTGLKPESGTQFEVGTKGNLSHGRFHYELAVFAATFKDKMTTVAVPLNPPAVGTAYSYIVNRGSYDDKGLEVMASYDLSSGHDGFISLIRPFFNFTYSDFVYDEYSFQTLSADKLSVVEVDYSGNAVAGVAPVTFNIGVDVYTKPGFYGNASYSYRDAIPFTSDGVNSTEAFSLVNAKVGFRHKWNEHWSTDLYAGAVNILGTKHFNMIFLNQLPDAYLAASPDINFFGGLNLKYTF